MGQTAIEAYEYEVGYKRRGYYHVAIFIIVLPTVLPQLPPQFLYLLKPYNLNSKVVCKQLCQTLPGSYR